MEPSAAYYQTVNEYGSGFRIKGNTVTAYHCREIFLKNENSDTNNEFDELSSSSLTDDETSRSTEVKRSPSSDSGNKRKVNSNSKDDELINETEISVKRIKSSSTHANISSSQYDGETSVEELLFSNDLILRIIFSNLNVKDLKSSRQVNLLWYFEATKILLKRDCLASIQVSDSTVTFKDALVYKRPISLQDFQNVVANSKFFPCNSFAVNNDPLSNNIINFFRAHGHLVESFCFEVERLIEQETIKSTASDILLLAAGFLPNLKYLILMGYLDEPSSPVMEMAIEVAPPLKNLNTLELEGDLPVEILALILRKSDNLESIYLKYFGDCNYDVCLTNMVKVGNAIPRLKNIDLLLDVDKLGVYSLLLEQNPRFSTIDMIDLLDLDEDADTLRDLAKSGRLLTSMLWKCPESVTQVKRLRRIGYIPELSIPVFPKVKHLTVEDPEMTRLPIDYVRCRAPLLPPGTNLAEIFPSVTSIEFNIWPDNDIVLKPEEIILEAVKSPMCSVRHVSLTWRDGYIPDIYIEKLCSFLPNVTSATFPLLSESSYKHIWKLSTLQEMQVEIETKTEVEPVGALDSAFTGFSVGSVKNLCEKDQADLNLSTEEVAALRTKPSIADLKHLRKLSLDLLHVTYQGVEEVWKNGEVIFDPGYGKTLLQVNGKAILSYVSKHFGFDLCPQLNSNVCVKYKHLTKFDI